MANQLLLDEIISELVDSQKSLAGPFGDSGDTPKLRNSIMVWTVILLPLIIGLTLQILLPMNILPKICSTDPEGKR
ncbi:MAG TPA: hypothetical protein VK622_11270 [Puia sp.]|nr:hypothetical protein [Puia sp.]